MMRYFTLIYLLFCVLQVHAQSKRDLANRHIRSCIIRDENHRKKGVKAETTFERYDRKGNTIERIAFDQDSLVSRWERMRYDRRGRQVLLERLDSAGQVVRRIETQFNRWGKETGQREYGKSGDLREQTLTTYNTFGDKVKVSVLDGAGKEKERDEYEYDAKGMLKTRRHYNAEGRLTEVRSFHYSY